MGGLLALQLERAHRRVRDLEGLLELRLNRQQPVEVVRVAVLAAELAYRLHAAYQAPGHFRRVIDDGGEPPQRLAP